MSGACQPAEKKEEVLLALAPGAMDFGIFDIERARHFGQRTLGGLDRLLFKRAYAAQTCPGDCGTVPALDNLCPDQYQCEGGGYRCCSPCGCVDVEYIFYTGGAPQGQVDTIQCDVAGTCTGCTSGCPQPLIRYRFTRSILTRKTCAASTKTVVYYPPQFKEPDCANCSLCNNVNNCRNCEDYGTACWDVGPYYPVPVKRPDLGCLVPVDCCATPGG